MIAWFARNGIAANLLMVAGLWTLWMDKVTIDHGHGCPQPWVGLPTTMGMVARDPGYGRPSAHPKD